MLRRDGLVLTMDGSTGTCSAALLGSLPSRVGIEQSVLAEKYGSGAGAGQGFEVLARRSEGDGRSQAKVLLRLVDEMLEEAGHRQEELGSVVVGTGPGTFTGVRVTVATARALSLALSVPVLGVSTLGALAAAAAMRINTAVRAGQEAGETALESQRVEVVVPVVDARRSQLFYGRYHAVRPAGPSGPCRYERHDEFSVCDRDGFGALIGSESTVVVGDEQLLSMDLSPAASLLSRTAVAEYLLVGQEYLEEPGPLPEGSKLQPWLHETGLSESVGREETPRNTTPRGPGTPESVKPIYVRSPDADVHIARMKDPWADASSGR
jgi:tRNA threonylcarbamoyl adenosine modification protein YeaZ